MRDMSGKQVEELSGYEKTACWMDITVLKSGDCIKNILRDSVIGS